MQTSVFIALDVHKATGLAVVTQEEYGSELRHLGDIPHRPEQQRLASLHTLVITGHGCPPDVRKA